MRFFFLIGMFFVAVCASGFVPTPGAMSDVRSQWLGYAVLVLVCVICLTVTVYTYFSGGPLAGIQALILTLVIGTVLVFAARELFDSALFLGWLGRG